MSRDRQRTGPATAWQGGRAGPASGPARGAPARGAPAHPRPAPGTRPVTAPRPGRPGTGQSPAASWPLRRSAGVPRAPFVLLVLAMLGGGLICLLVINTTLGATSFQIDHLQQVASARQLQAQLLQNQLAADESDATIQREACQLGMRPRQELEFLDLRTHRLRSSASVAASVAWCPASSRPAQRTRPAQTTQAAR
jgi:hypothetical protein